MIELKKIAENQYFFELKTDAGQSLLTSISFANKVDAEQNLKQLVNVRTKPLFERKTNHEGKFHFDLKNKEGLLIACSQLYNSEAGMENGIKNVRSKIKAANMLN